MPIARTSHAFASPRSPGKDGRKDLAALPGAAPGRSAPRAAAGGGGLHALPGQRLHLYPSGRPEGVFLPAHAAEGLAGDRVPSKSEGEPAALLWPGSRPLTNLSGTRGGEAQGRGKPPPPRRRAGPPGPRSSARPELAALCLLPFPPVGPRPALPMPAVFPFPNSPIASLASTRPRTETFTIRDEYTFSFIIGRDGGICLIHATPLSQMQTW